MRLSTAPTSFPAAFAASQALLSIGSTTSVAKVISVAYKRESQKYTNQSKSATEECSFLASPNLRGVDADLGILSCSDPENICVEDRSSSLGGRCMSLSSGRRKMQEATECDTKCTPASACEGLSADFIANNIGLGSCCGDYACVGVSESSTIGEKSCIGYKTCYKMLDATIGDNSCTGDSIKGADGYYGYVCAHASGTIANDSCYEYAACYQTLADSAKYTWDVGANSCRGKNACFYDSAMVIPGGTCNGEFSCYKLYETVGTESCNGSHSCTYSEGAVSDSSCNGYYACYNNEKSIGRDSCNAKSACENNKGVIGDTLCNTEEECKDNTETVTLAPTAAPTSPPTKGNETSPPTAAPVTSAPSKADETSLPTASPTKKPTSDPTKNPTTAPTEKDATPAPTKKPVVTSSPTKNPTKRPTTKAPTANPTSAAPTQNPVTISPTLVLTVDLCYPGCGDFTDIYTNNEFEDMIMKYTPCTTDECTVTIVGESDVCTPCSLVSSRGLRFLQDGGFQSSAITFEIESTKPLNEQVVTGNLNDSITEANDDLEQDGIDFYVSGNYKEATKAPTKQPTKKPTPVASAASSKSSKSDRRSKSSKHAGKSSKSSYSSSKSGKSGYNEHEGHSEHKEKKTNTKKQEMKKKLKEMKKKGYLI
jgi:hypothetical protein